MNNMMHNQPAGMARRDVVLSAILALFLIGGLLTSAFVYQSVRGFVARTQLPIFPSAATAAQPAPTAVAGAPEGAAPVESVEGSALPVLAPDQPPPPEATERLTVLLMGIDRRDGEEGPWRTDSMILITIDPRTDEVAMLSTPRDLMVTIPDYGRGEQLDRINTAYYSGDAFNYPGGGPALAKATIRRNFGIEVDRYLVLDFNGFRRLIDYIGGVEVDVPEPLVDTQYPTEDYGIMTVRFDEGTQLMDGERALIYSRTRKSTSDFARAERQQQVILAVRDRVLSLDIISSLTPANLARLIATLDDSVATDMTLDEVLALAPVARRVESGAIRRMVVDPNMVREYVTYTGAQVLLPRWSLILPEVERIFENDLLAMAPQAPTPPPLPTATPVPPTRVPVESQVTVLNGTPIDGIERVVARRLAGQGFVVTGVGPADRRDYARSTILLNDPDAADAAARLASLYGIAPDDIQRVDEPNGAEALILIVGSDALDETSGEGG